MGLDFSSNLMQLNSEFVVGKEWPHFRHFRLKKQLYLAFEADLG